MTLDTLDADAEESLARVAGHQFRRVDGPKLSGGAFGGRRAFDEEQLANDGIVRTVLDKLTPQPARDRNRAFRLNLLTIDAQQIAEAQRRIIGILGACEERIDELCSLVRRVIGEERPSFRGGRQGAANVKGGAAKKRRIVAQFARWDAETLELVPGEAINEVGLRRTRDLYARARDRDATDRQMAQITGQDRSLARHIAGLHEAAAVDAGNNRRVRFVLRLHRHATAEACLVDGPDAELAVFTGE